MPRFIVHHITKYTYPTPVRDSANQIMLFPIKDDYQELVDLRISITGEPPVEVYRDYYDNEIGAFTYSHPHTQLIIDSKTEVVTKSRDLPADTAGISEQWAALSDMRYEAQIIDFLQLENFAEMDEVRSIADPRTLHLLTPYQAAQVLCDHVFINFSYIKGITEVDTTLAEVWRLKAGVCQDFAHILLVMLRLIGIPARYVSGYICPATEGMRGEGATHAWVEAYLPGYGWLGFDPTNNCIANELHVRLAVGRNFNDCSPVRGTYKGTSQHRLEVGVSVIYEDGHVTLKEDATVLNVSPAKPVDPDQNSYRRYMEMQQQQ
jgi:transglutaminase-like putative cysteine protease